MAVPGFLFGGSTGETPSSIRQKRELVRAIMGASNAPKNIGEGLNALGDGIVANVLDRRANKAEEAGQSAANSLFNSILGGPSPIPSPDAASQVSAGAPTPAGPQSYRDAIAGIESAGSGDYSAIGPTSPKLGRALGRYQVMEANIGPWSQETLGRTVTPDEFLADPKLQDAIFDKKFGGYVQQYGPQGAAQAWFAGPGGVGKLDRKDSLGTSVGAYGEKFARALGGGQQVASLDPSAGMAQSPPPQSIEVGAAQIAARAPMQGPTQPAPPLPAPTTITNAPPVAAQPPVAAPPPQQVAQNAPQQGGQFGGVDPRLLQALQNPWLNDGQKQAVQLLIQQQMQAGQQQQEEQTWRAREDYKLNTQRADPAYKLEQDYKQAQLEALKAKTGKSNLINAGEGNIYDPDTNTWIKAPSATGKTGDAFRFGGNSVEAQALNGLIESGQITADQAQQLGAGKTITDPSTGSMMFLTPQGIFQQQGQRPAAQQQPYVDLFGDGGANVPPSPPAAATQPTKPAAAAPAMPPVPASDPVSSSNPGIIPLTGGKPQKLLTEAERKNQSLFTVIKPELKVVEDNYNALTDPNNQIYSKMPFSEFVTTPEYQQAANSLQTIVSSYLYSVSGATATPDEVRKQTDILTPRPGESKESIENKKRRIRTMVNAVAQAGSLPPMDEPTAPSGNDADIQAARDAIARGAPRDKVIQRLRDANIDPSGL